MWRGFFATGDLRAVWLPAILQVLTVLASFAFYALRNTQVAQQLVRWSDLPPGTDRAKLSYVGCLMGAYGLTSTNFVAATGMYLVNVTIDVWASGNAT